MRGNVNPLRTTCLYFAYESQENNSNMAAENKDKLKALQLTLDRLDKTYGKGTVMKLGR